MYFFPKGLKVQYQFPFSATSRYTTTRGGFIIVFEGTNYLGGGGVEKRYLIAFQYDDSSSQTEQVMLFRLSSSYATERLTQLAPGVASLTYSTNGFLLDASQGKTLDDKITSATTKTAASAPTETTAGTVGQLYFDTAAQELYICTKGTSAYAWKKIA